MSNIGELFARLGMTKENFESLADQHNTLIGDEPNFINSEGYVMTEAEMNSFCSLFQAADKNQQVLLASMLRFINRELAKETA